MKSQRIFVAVILALGMAVPAMAQYVGILQSAETMDKGNFKLMAAPVMVFGKEGADDELGVAARLGYAFTNSFDAELKVGLFDGVTFVGADGELWLVKGKGDGIDLSLAGGLHWLLGDDDSFDVMGFELTPQFSKSVTGNLDLCAALAVAFESIEDAPRGMEDSFTRLHVVPGFEYRLSNTVDLAAEFGIALNDDSHNYLSAGLSFYLR